MTKPISKSKRQLAQLLIEAGVTQFPEGANWAAQDKCDLGCAFSSETPTHTGGSTMHHCNASRVGQVNLPTLIPNWHQTVLSRDEFDQIVAETVVTPGNIAEKIDIERVEKYLVANAIDQVATPTLDQLLQDWRNADDYAQRKQTEADEAAAMRDERWQAVQARAGEMGVTVGRCESVVDDLSIADWRDLRVNDVIWVPSEHDNIEEGEYIVVFTEPGGYTGDRQVMVTNSSGSSWWIDTDRGYRFIHRP